MGVLHRMQRARYCLFVCMCACARSRKRDGDRDRAQCMCVCMRGFPSVCGSYNIVISDIGSMYRLICFILCEFMSTLNVLMSNSISNMRE